MPNEKTPAARRQAIKESLTAVDRDMRLAKQLREYAERRAMQSPVQPASEPAKLERLTIARMHEVADDIMRTASRATSRLEEELAALPS